MNVRKLVGTGTALMLAGAFGVAADDVPKEQRGPGKIVIFGDLKLTSVYRDNTVDFRSKRVLQDTGTDGLADSKTNNPAGLNTFNDSEMLHRVQVNLGLNADLGKEASAVVRMNATDFPGRTFGAQDGTASDLGVSATASKDQQREFEIELREAYFKVDNFLAAGLSFSAGQQELRYGLNRGDGTSFLLATGDLGHRFQLRNGGNVDYAFNTKTSGATASQLNFNEVRGNKPAGFAYKFAYAGQTGDNAYGADLFYDVERQVGIGRGEVSILGLAGNFATPMVGKDKMLLTAHLFHVTDNDVRPEEDSGGQRDIGRGADYYMYGAGAHLPYEMVELFGEFDIQTGKFQDKNPGVGVNDQEKDQNAYAFYLGGRFTAKNLVGNATPAIESSYWYYSGDDNNQNNSNKGYINWGSNKGTLIAEDNEFGIGLSNNYSVWRIKGMIDFDKQAGPAFMQGTSKHVELSFHQFWVNEDSISAANSTTGATTSESDLGTEWDVKLVWGIRENIDLSLGLGWFMPGKYAEKNAQLGGLNTGPGGRDEGASTLTMARFDIGVRF